MKFYWYILYFLSLSIYIFLTSISSDNRRVFQVSLLFIYLFIYLFIFLPFTLDILLISLLQAAYFPPPPSSPSSFCY